MPAPFWPASGSAPWLFSGLDWRHVARQRPRQGPGYTDGRRLAPCQQSPGGLLRRTAPLSLRHQHLRQLRMAARQVECLRQWRPPALEDLHLHTGGSGGIPWQGQPLHLQPQFHQTVYLIILFPILIFRISSVS